MNLGKVRNYVKDKQSEYLDALFALLRQKSISAQNIGIEETSQLLLEILVNIGVNARLIETEGHPVVYGEIMKQKSVFTLLIYGHYDVQPPDPIEEWHSPPFEPTIRDGKIYCRGVGDNKGQLMAQILAIKTYQDVFGELPINIKLVFEGEEESGSPNIEKFVEENQDLLQADLVYTSDGPMHESGTPLVLLGVRGMLYVELIARGAKWDNHSGNKGNIAPNPAWKLVELLNTMRGEKGNVLIDGFYDEIRKPEEFEMELVRSLPFDAKQIAKQVGYEWFDMNQEEYYRKLMFEPTFNIAGLHSGYVEEGTKTIIPAIAHLKMDMRLVANQDPDDIYQKLVDHVHNYAQDIEVIKLGSMKPSRTSANSKFVQIVKDAVEQAYQQPPIIQPSLGGSLPDYVWTQTLGVPSIIVPYANADEANHSPNENLVIDCFFNGIICTCQVIAMLGEKTNSIK